MVTIAYYGAARAAAGRTSEVVAVEPTGTMADLLLLITQRHGAALATVLARCSYLLDERAVRTPDQAIGSAARLDVLPPFAGGGLGRPPG